MYGSDGVKSKLHENLLGLNEEIPNIKILYSKVPVHSKCYAWKDNNRIIHALIGSANFSVSGLTIPYKEILAETTYDTFEPLNAYINTIIQNSIECIDVEIIERQQGREIEIYNEKICTMTLLDPQTNEVQNSSGLNWGQSAVAHVNPNDALIPIRTVHIRNYPELFPPKQLVPIYDNKGRANRHNDGIDIIWDDGTSMQGLLEGTQPVDGIKYPKQIASAPQKSILGEYIRKRVGVPLGARITKRHLNAYGRTNIDVSLEAEGVYYFDFSV